MDYYYSDENMNEILEITYEGAKIMINELEKVSNMDDAIRYFLKYDSKNITFRCGLDDSCFDEEGMYYARKEFDYRTVDEFFKRKRSDLAGSLWNESEKLERIPLINAWEESLKEDRMKFLSNEEDYEKGMKLLKEHYETNIDKLIGYGLDIKKKLEF